jgi:head-tail adaptor
MTWTPPAAGELRSRVRFDRRGAGENSGGVVRSGFAPLIASRRARLLPVKGGEEVIADRVAGVSGWELVIRFDSATSRLAADDRVVDLRDDTRVFDIKFVEDLEGRRRWLVLQLERGKGDGREGA